MLLVTPEGCNLRVERGISPPLKLAVTIPLSVNGRKSFHDGFVIYVAIGAFHETSRDSDRTLKAIATAVHEHLCTMRPIDVDTVE